MARYELAPTKTNLMKVKRDLGFANEGWELMGLIDRAVEAQVEVEKRLAVAFGALDQAMLRMGRRDLTLVSLGVHIRSDIKFSERRIMGVSIPKVRVEFDDKSPYVVAVESSIWLSEANVRFREVLKLIGTLAEARISLMRLSREVAKTIRRVNALEKVFIPDYEETLKYINSSLEEMDREAFFINKMIKSHLQKRKEAAQ
jgi:V/A-type H+-transporting ATPase subunit D